MRKIILDGRRMKSQEGAHAYIKRKCGFPEWYGANLDALYDCLTDMSEETELAVKYERALCRNLGAYAPQLTETLLDASRANTRLHVLFAAGGRIS